MPTPSIQTLTTDAQQVLNLDSISAVRSVVAVALANANTGTPLNPNLTTQQLWNEFYQVVTKPKSDIESIIANQLMKFLFAPPAPGGVGADKQVIFNDGGVLAGDPQFLWDKTANLLTVTGSATITGDLTVATSALKVNSSNGRVGIGTASPANPLHISGTNPVPLLLQKTGSTDVYLSFTDSSGVFGYFGFSNGDLRFQTPGQAYANKYVISSDGTSTWSNVGGVAGTAMTLNAYGLGVGTSPSVKGHFYSASGSNGVRLQTGSTTAGDTNRLSFQNASGAADVRTGCIEWYDVGAFKGDVRFLKAGGIQIRNSADSPTFNLDDTGNVGIGVTPSAWAAGYKAIQIAASQSTALMGSGNQTELTTNAFFDGAWKYQGAGTVAASRYSQQSGVHYWYTAAAGAAGTAIGSGFSTAAMTLDASGNLLVGTTTTSGNAGGLKLSNVGGTLGQITFSNNSGVADYVTRFNYGSTPTLVGTITVASGGTTYNTTSDYRLKESVQPLVGGLARVSALKPSIYKWKSDGSSGEGFLAHELAEVVPFAVTGEKDAVNEDGSVKAQGVDLSRVVPILVAAIQELAAEVNALKNA